MAKQAKLSQYYHKRDFAQTPEPSGQASKPTKATMPSPATDNIQPEPQHHRVFVVQMHDARQLHYDFRLEVDGVLKSWAVPKGPSLSPSQKHLAVMTEDHPLEYAAFEGVIPDGNYGAGPVLVWDGGTYRNLRRDKSGKEVPMDQACEEGHVTVFLEGRKLRGGFALNRTSTVRGKENWILVKMRDEFAQDDVDVLGLSQSILTGRIIEEVAQDQPSEEINLL